MQLNRINTYASQVASFKQENKMADQFKLLDEEDFCMSFEDAETSEYEDIREHAYHALQ